MAGPLGINILNPLHTQPGSVDVRARVSKHTLARMRWRNPYFVRVSGWWCLHITCIDRGYLFSPPPPFVVNCLSLSLTITTSYVTRVISLSVVAALFSHDHDQYT